MAQTGAREERESEKGGSLGKRRKKYYELSYVLAYKLRGVL